MTDRLLVIGGDAGGMTAISHARRGRSDLEVVVVERGRWTSYSACGIPYLVGGEVERLEQLVVRSPGQFRREGVDVRIGHEAVAIDLDRRHVEVRTPDGADATIGFDHLLVATGGLPVRPPLPGIDLPMVYGVQTLGDAEQLLSRVEGERVRNVVVVGGGYIGLEMAEAFVQRGVAVALVEHAPDVMAATLDPEMGALVGDALQHHGVDLHVGTEVTGFEEGAVVTGAGRLRADLVVLGIGVGPNASLAEEAGLEMGPTGAIRVDARQATSANGVWAAGDCCESNHLVTGRPVHVALGTVANKQSRVAGINIGGGHATFPGVLGTAISKICATEVARTGLSCRQAEQAGLDTAVTTVETTTTAGYMPNAEPMTIRLLSETGTGRLLGAQIVGGAGSAKRIDTCAVALTARMTLGDLVDLDLSYAPPFSGVWDPVQVAARKALNG
jgi:NADPH-dependent 2,4-dienoyl-CoA reductase/sulfur reductase-like enzyme